MCPLSNRKASKVIAIIDLILAIIFIILLVLLLIFVDSFVDWVRENETYAYYGVRDFRLFFIVMFIILIFVHCIQVWAALVLWRRTYYYENDFEVRISKRACVFWCIYSIFLITLKIPEFFLLSRSIIALIVTIIEILFRFSGLYIVSAYWKWLSTPNRFNEF